MALLGAAQCIGRSCKIFAFREGIRKIVFVSDIGQSPHSALIPANFHLLYPDLAGFIEFLKDATEIHIYITHAHLDHVGGLPAYWKYIRAHFPLLAVRLHMTRETWVLSLFSWNESMRKMANANGDYPEWDGAESFFDKETISDMAHHLQFVEIDNTYELSRDVLLTPRGAKHILGATSLDLLVFKELIHDTGDFSCGEHPFIANHAPIKHKKTKMLLSEATNAGEDLHDRLTTEHELGYNVRRIVQNKGGIALLVTFQIDRAQVVIETLIRNGVPPEMIFIDGGARYVTRKYHSLLSPGTLSRVQYIQSPEHREQILENGYPCAIVASGGMMHGIALWWAKQLLPSEKNGIFINGWYDKCTPADKLMQAMNEKTLEQKHVEFDTGDLIPIRAEVHKARLSAHASGPELEQRWVDMNPEILVLNHGEKERVKKYLKSFSVSGIHFPKTRNSRGGLVVIDF